MKKSTVFLSMGNVENFLGFVFRLFLRSFSSNLIKLRATQQHEFNRLTVFLHWQSWKSRQNGRDVNFPLEKYLNIRVNYQALAALHRDNIPRERRAISNRPV